MDLHSARRAISGRSPLVTVAFPMRDQAWCLERILESLHEQTYPKKRIQLVFVDDCSTDNTLAIVRNWKSLHENEYFHTVLVQTRNVAGSIPGARNLCLNHAKGDIVVFWDSDILPPQDGLESLVSITSSTDSGVGVVAFPCDIEKPNLLDRIIRAREPAQSSVVRAVGMGFTAIKSDVVNRVGLFNLGFRRGEDVEYCIRAHKMQFQSVYNTTIRCRHLKRIDEQAKYRSSYKDLLRYCFLEESKQIIVFASYHHWFLIWKSVYYFLFPFVITIVCVFRDTPVLLWSMSYFLVLLAYSLLVSKKIVYGFLSALVFIPPGIATSYGLLVHLVRKRLRTLGIRVRNHGPHRNAR